MTRYERNKQWRAANADKIRQRYRENKAQMLNYSNERYWRLVIRQLVRGYTQADVDAQRVLNALPVHQREAREDVMAVYRNYGLEYK